jgi:nucleoside-diphosphate-sugar epimerase
MRILILGASGCIGRHLTAALPDGGHTVRAAIRRPYPFCAAGYTGLLSYAKASLWLDPFGVLTKNLAVLLLALVWAAREDER